MVINHGTNPYVGASILLGPNWVLTQQNMARIFSAMGGPGFTKTITQLVGGEDKNREEERMWDDWSALRNNDALARVENYF